MELANPALLDTPPRNATEIANTTAVVASASILFTTIGTGALDPWLTQVFGAPHIATAKARYANGATRLNALHASNHIVADRGSGFADEAFEGGLSGPNIIRVAPSVIDHPGDADSGITLLHESMHAGNSGVVGDPVYLNATGFTTESAPTKLGNAAHYEVVPWRVLAPTDARAYPATPATTPPTFQTFVPAGTTVTPPGSTTPITAAPRTPAELGAEAAYDRFKDSWALGLNLHRKYVELLRTPAQWTVPQFGGRVRFDNSIPFWSKVQKLTIHEKTVINPASANSAEHPVSQVDVALSEGLTRRLAQGMFTLAELQSEAKIHSYERARSSATELSTQFPTGHTNADAERDFLLRLTVRSGPIGPLTGRASRDLRVLQQMTDPATTADWLTILASRNPDSFAD